MIKQLKVAGVVVIAALMLGGVVAINFIPPTNQLAQTVATVRSGVVHIEKPGAWQGSGFVVTSDGLVVTAKHVVEGGGEFIVTMDDGTKYRTTIALVSKDYDIGFLQIHPIKPIPFVRLSFKNDWMPGDPVFIMGSPLGFDNFNSVTLGIISAKQRNLDAVQDEGFGWTVTFQSDAAAYPGNSGGPVFSMDGKVIGILVAGMDSNLNYSVPTILFVHNIETLKTIVKETQFQVLEPSPVEELPQIDYMSMIFELQEQIKDLQRQIDELKPPDRKKR